MFLACTLRLGSSLSPVKGEKSKRLKGEEFPQFPKTSGLNLLTGDVITDTMFKF